MLTSLSVKFLASKRFFLATVFEQNLTLAVTNGKYYPTFELGFLGDFEDLENVSEMVAETSETSKDQKSESATGDNNTCTCMCSEKCCHRQPRRTVSEIILNS